MTKKELWDNTAFLSTLKMLVCMTERKLLSEAEAKWARTELKPRLWPTLIFA